MNEVSADDIRRVMTDPDPVIEAFSLLLRSVAGDAVQTVAVTLGMVGHDPRQLPGEFFAQAVLVEADKIFAEITRERWIEVFDSYHRIKDIVNNDPALKAEVELRNLQRRTEVPQESQAPKAEEPGLLDGNF